MVDCATKALQLKHMNQQVENEISMGRSVGTVPSNWSIESDAVLPRTEMATKTSASQKNPTPLDVSFSHSFPILMLRGGGFRALIVSAEVKTNIPCNAIKTQVGSISLVVYNVHSSHCLDRYLCNTHMVPIGEKKGLYV